ncbi:hypothetical protein O6D23_02860 [Legionella pneumophila]|uniref:hypothetical protein n=1 Tax=Legionella pneumophila TaxID=446 RepID=UPI0022B43E63|nr:hypothetical protein [Legionella pneumophila]MCZ4786695.1 hypothetical protein [Legionella pneumophila]
MENWTSWRSESLYKKNCLANLSSKCPLIKNEGILFERFMRNEQGEILRYNDPKKTPIPIDLKVDLSGKTNPALALWHVNHETLTNYCNSSSPCKITIHYGLKKERVYHKTEIVIDVINKDQIIDIIPLNGGSYLTVKRNPIVPNTILFEYKNLDQKNQGIREAPFLK